jgi:hypothetical protein
MSSHTKPVQEPVAWRYTDARGHYRYRGYVPNFDVEYKLLKPQALCLCDQPAAPVQEPVGRVTFEGDEVVWTGEPPESGTLLYTTPPAAQPAEPLSIEKVSSMDYRGTLDEHIRSVRMTEAAHGITKGES